MEPATGRARGRARGRGRSQQVQQQQGAAAGNGQRRPGDPPPTAAPQPAVGAVPPTRASHHPSAAAAAGTEAGGLVQQMSAMQVASSSVGDSTEAQASSGGAAAGVASVGRGATRGRREAGYQERTIDVTRPSRIVSKRGDIGQQIQLIANYFQMVDRTTWSIKQYRVDFDPPEDNTRMRKKLLRVHQQKLGQHYIFDGTMLFMEKSLPEQEVEYISKRETDDATVRIMIKFTQEIPPTDYTFLQIFNIITNQCMALVGYQKLKKMDREYFDVKQAMQADQGRLEIWPGFGAAVAQHENKVLMCVSVTHKVLRNDSVLDQLISIQKRSPQNVQNIAERELLGAIVMCRHNLKTYRVDDILWNQTPDSEFDLRGRKISVAQYYKERYNIEVRRDQPLICSRPKRREQRAGQDQPFWLVPQLCNMTGLSDDMRANNNMMKELSAYLNMAPRQRVEKLRRFSETLNRSQEVRQLLDFWGLKFADDLLRITGRVLPAEMVKTSVETQARDGTWNDAVKTGVSSYVNLDRWQLFYTQRTQEAAAKCLTTVTQVAKGFNMRVSDPLKVLVTDDRVQGYVQTLDQNLKPGAQLVMCMIPSKDKTRYDAIKQLLCLRKPVPSQVITARLIQTNKNIMGVATKIALQLNCKLGGIPWEVRIPTKQAMVVGYDTYHDSQHRGASAGAWVASTNASCSQYFSCATIHRERQEICDHMEINMHKSMEAFKQKNDAYPRTVFMYRDGVGEGQVRYVVQHEVERIREAIAKKSPETKLCFIIVTKRINARLMVAGPRGVDNPPPGTIVDDDITLPQRYDFYLISQKTRIGTVTPTMYNVIYDDTNFQPKHVQILSYKLAHLYFNLTSTVRVPAPCHYAHRLAFLVGQSLHQEPSVQLANELFFL